MELINRMLDLKDETIASLKEQIHMLEKENSELKAQLGFEKRKNGRKDR